MTEMKLDTSEHEAIFGSLPYNNLRQSRRLSIGYKTPEAENTQTSDNTELNTA